MFVAIFRLATTKWSRLLRWLGAYQSAAYNAGATIPPGPLLFGLPSVLEPDRYRPGWMRKCMLVNERHARRTEFDLAQYLPDRHAKLFC